MGTCDWGDCDKPTYGFRFSVQHRWLPVCETHYVKGIMSFDRVIAVPDVLRLAATWRGNSLHRTEARVAADLLDLAADKFSNHGCNDFELPNTPEHLELTRRLIAASDYPEDEPQLSADGTAIYLMDWQVMRYCADVLRRYADDE